MTHSLKGCDLYPGTSRGPGDREYMAGYLGGLKVLIFKNHNPPPDGPSHALFITGRPPRQEKPPPLPSIGARDGYPAVAELADAFDRRGPDPDIPF